MGVYKQKTCQDAGNVETEKMQAGGMPSIGVVQFVQKKMNKLCSEKREQNRIAHDYMPSNPQLASHVFKCPSPLIPCHSPPHDPAPTHPPLLRFDTFT